MTGMKEIWIPVRIQTLFTVRSAQAKRQKKNLEKLFSPSKFQLCCFDKCQFLIVFTLKTKITLQNQLEQKVDSSGFSHVGTRLGQCGHAWVWDNCSDQNEKLRGMERSSWLPSGNIFRVPVNRIQFQLNDG